jgi:chaperonin cofactor prefoldin
MTKEQVLKRKQELERQREHLVANANAIAGAIQDCEFWLSEFDKATNELEPITKPE